MPQSPYKTSLVVGAGLSIIAALLHVACIFGGPSWYRFFGVGDRRANRAFRLTGDRLALRASNLLPSRAMQY